MIFLKLFLRSFSLLPSLVQGCEALYGAQTGAQKREAAVAMVGSAFISRTHWQTKRSSTLTNFRRRLELLWMVS